jgi:hypothetical protein
MAKSTISVHIDRSAVLRMNQPTGMVHRYVSGIADEVLAEMFITAPERTGKLKSKLKKGKGSWSQSGVSVRIFSGAKYTTYVHGGTYDPILPRNGRAMKLRTLNPALPMPRRKGQTPYPPGTRVNKRYASAVGGQRAKPFMTRALRNAMARHGH